MVKKLLCATDGSHPSEKAVQVAVDLAKSLNAELAFLTVETVSSERAAKTFFWDSQLLEAGDALVHRELGSARKAAERAGLGNVHCVTTYGRDIAQAIEASFARRVGGVFNVCDDEPTPPGDPIRFAAGLIGVAPPPAVPFAQAVASMSPLAASFFGESRRVRNERMKRELGVRLRYPTFRDGLRALHAAGD